MYYDNQMATYIKSNQLVHVGVGCHFALSCSHVHHQGVNGEVRNRIANLFTKVISTERDQLLWDKFGISEFKYGHGMPTNELG